MLWTDGPGLRIVPSQKRGKAKMAAWKRWYERQGWQVKTFSQTGGMIAYPAGWDGSFFSRRAIVLRELDGD